MEAGNTAPGSSLENPDAEGLTILTLRSTAGGASTLLRRTYKTSPAAGRCIERPGPDRRHTGFRCIRQRIDKSQQRCYLSKPGIYALVNRLFLTRSSIFGLILT
jgi:hypothetical protein